MIHNPPFYGKGIAFPPRIDPNTGGFQITEGVDDPVSVSLSYMVDRWTMREAVRYPANHIAEAIAHILLTSPLEHDTLPPFGGTVFNLIFEPNTIPFQQYATSYFLTATERWEKRAQITKDGVVWSGSDTETDQGIAALKLSPDFIRQQAAGNLVAPFVDPRQARLQEYPLGDKDAVGHDATSRYFGQAVYEDSRSQFLRSRRFKSIQPKPDDLFYTVKHNDTWLLISYETYGDIRFQWVIADIAVNEIAAQQGSRDAMDTTGNPVPGTLLRMPSMARIYSENFA